MNILLTGAISLSNKGTCAIAISTINTIRKYFPNDKIDIELFYPDKQRDIYPIDKELNVNIVKPPIQNPIYGLSIFIYIMILPYIRKVFKNWNYFVPKHYANADIVIDISAEAFIKYYDDDFIQYTKRYLLHLYPLLVGIFLGKRIVLLSQTMAPFGYFKPLMKYIIRRCAYMSVRDDISIKNLEKEGIDISNIHISADPAFLLDASSKDKIDQILIDEHLDLIKIRNEGSIVLGVCLAKTTGRVLDEKELRHLIEIVSRTLDSLIVDKKLFVIFVPHSSGKIRTDSDDVLVGERLKEILINKQRFFLIKGDYSPQDIKGIIRECDIMLSLRMHPIIAALSLGIPSILIAFNDKAYGLMKRFDLENYVCDIRNLSEDELYIKLTTLVENRHNIHEKINAKLPYINKLITDSFDNLYKRMKECNEL